jgi:hypothetical protein
MSNISKQRFDEYKAELLDKVNEINLKKLINAYNHPNPIESMEKELGEILLEVLENED